MRLPLLKTLLLAGAVGVAAPATSAQTVLFDFEGTGGDTQGWEPDQAPDQSLGEGAQSKVETLDAKAVAFENGAPLTIDAFEGTWMLNGIANRPLLANEYRGMKYTWDTPQDWTATPILKLAASMQANGGNSEQHQFRIIVTADDGSVMEMEYVGLKSLGFLKENDRNVNEGQGDTVGDTFVNEWQVLTLDLSGFAGVGSVKSIEAAGRNIDDGTDGTPDASAGNWGGTVQIDQVTVEARQNTAVEGAPGVRSLSEAYPNPTRGTATLDLVVETPQMVTARVVDVLGRTVQTEAAHSAVAGTELPIRIATSGFAPGTYLVVVEGETFRQTRRLTVSR